MLDHIFHNLLLNLNWFQVILVFSQFLKKYNFNFKKTPCIINLFQAYTMNTIDVHIR